ncbi:PRTRC system protein F [Undibacterium arcticum]
MIQRVVAREIAAAVGNLKVLTPYIAISDGEIGEGCERNVELDENASITFQIHLDHSPIITIGKVLCALEDIAEGLGQTVYSVLKAAAWAGMGLFTFDYAVDSLPYLYGLEEDDEDELGDEDDEESDDRITKATLLANIPGWFVSPELKLTPEDVTRISNQTSIPQWAKTVLNATLQAADAWTKGAHKLGKFSYSDAEPAYHTAAIRFSEEDQMSRILDDYYDMCNQCSDHYTDAMHMEFVDLSDTHKFNQWWDGILDGCRLLKTVDALLDALSCQLT